MLLRRDWEFLFDQLKSTHAVAAYLRRVAGEDMELGAEPVRYHQLATLDSQAGPGGLDPAIKELGAAERWEPMLPLTPVGSEDVNAHQFFRSILEDIATIELQTTTEQVRIRALAELDRLPTEHRAHVGNYLQRPSNSSRAPTGRKPCPGSNGYSKDWGLLSCCSEPERTFPMTIIEECRVLGRAATPRVHREGSGSGMKRQFRSVFC